MLILFYSFEKKNENPLSFLGIVYLFLKYSEFPLQTQVHLGV
ncbi:hypothetical protein H206_05195 [Candidatus Electrothrix aarhusensis]|uniref:Uncharacterized protein n=1 Tax=Candidatus Electrothrix aarhusensis TaxID=1859131 RepID=A0A3S3R216_9BACT|nr:hypothetical protein H206_05195 [Candidatus Electrothrix aarhusensis]